MVFSSIGDTTRSHDSSLRNAVRSGPLATHPLLQSAVSGAGTLARGLFTTLFPADCRICGLPLSNISRLPVCLGCIGAMTPVSGPLCAICGEALAQEDPFGEPTLCAPCQEKLPPYKQAVAYGAYDSELRELIHLLKYDQVHPAASVLGTMLARAISKLDLTGPGLVVPVPLHASKRRQRGFNQAELIARNAVKCDHDGLFHLATDLLVRVRPTVSQIGLTRHQRQENIRGAFKVPRPGTVSGRDLLLVDDVMTTGTTAAECARILRRAGARNVWVASVARTLKNNIGTEPATEEVAEAAVNR
jgi:ComF family protein